MPRSRPKHRRPHLEPPKDRAALVPSKDAAKALGISPRRLYFLLSHGRLGRPHGPKRYVITAGELYDFYCLDRPSGRPVEGKKRRPVATAIDET